MSRLFQRPSGSEVVPHTPAFIVIEGLTGSGKTTIANWLAEAHDFARPTLITPSLAVAQAEVEDDPHQLDSRYALFISAVLRLAQQVNLLLGEGRSVVVDSWHYRTTATHEALGSTLRWTPPSWLPSPTLAVFLDLDESTRRKRVIDRGTPSGYWKTQCESRSADIRRIYARVAPELRWVDSSSELQDVARVIEGMMS